jgi:CPA2 family monovalent cation:H+ antiporter-2/glutathione-regulated potassium-efflux system protein KefB
MAAESAGFDLVPVVVLLGSAVVAVPLFKRFGLGSVLGYLASGLAIGPFGLGLFSDPATILHVAELGVVMFLFIIGLEMQPSRLWSMRKDIFGLGLAQVLACMALLSWVGVALGFPWSQSVIAGAGFVLTSTAIVMQLLEERGELTTPMGGRIVSILLLEDLAIVPLLALAAFLAPGGEDVTLGHRLASVAIGLGCIAALVLAGRYLLDPMFRLLARARAREVMTAAALLVVLGAALGMQLGGLSAAMGAFLAGVLLSESSFRHQLESEVEPFRGILLGLFFLAVGMSLDLTVIAQNWRLVAVSVVAFMVLKAIGTYAIARLFHAPHSEALERMVLMTQGGEFAFVLYAAALSVGLIDATGNAVLTAIIIVSMLLTPVMVLLHDRLVRPEAVSEDGMERPDGLSGTVLVIGFGRFSQIVSQPILARGYSISLIDTDPAMIRAAASFGFKVYYGDGTRLDILHAAGAGHARAVVVGIDDKAAATRIVGLLKAEFPMVPVLARAFDRAHEMELIRAGADEHIRETFESALTLGARSLSVLGEDPEVIDEVLEQVRRRDAERFARQFSEGIMAGQDLLLANSPKPETA